MHTKYALLVAVATVLTSPAFAESTTTASEIPSVETDAQTHALIGAKIDMNASGAGADPYEDTGPLFVIDGNNMKSTGEWTPEDSRICKEAGGVELPVSAGRMICINL